MNQAKACTEKYLEAVRSENYLEADKYYSQLFSESETPEERIEKMKKLTEVMGKITSFQLTDSAEKNEGDEQLIMFTYKVKHTKINSIEKFMVMKNEGGYEITGHDIKSE